MNSARALDVKNVLTFIHIFQLRQWKVEKVGGINILGHPVVFTNSAGGAAAANNS